MAEADGITVRAIAGTHAVILGMDATPQAREGLLGFGIGKRRPDGSLEPLRGFKFFAETVPDPQPGERRSTFEHPIQDFQWGDYAAAPGGDVTYVVRAIYGTPGALEPGPEIEVRAQTGNAAGSLHEVHFNRGAIPSQAFADRFGNVGPTEDEVNDPGNAKVQWLSRGLLEAMLGFIAEARGPRYEVRVAAYEFVYRPVLEALAAAAGRGATVRICFDAGDRRQDGSIVPSHTSAANFAEIARAGLDGAPTVSLHPRTRYSAIPHNKFMVLHEEGRPIAVWTGSTNFTASGFLGQSNVAHLIRDPALGAQYDAYWEMIATDPGTTAFKSFNTKQFPDAAKLVPDQIQPIFSPRKAGMLDWYAQALREATASAMFTAAFGVSQPLAEAFGEDRDFLRLLLMESRENNPERRALITADRDTVIALGERLNSETIQLEIEGFRLDQWFRAEEHFRKKGHIFYIHTKILGLDLLSDDPKLFTGSANFSKNSVESNDENMLLMRGPAFRQIADIYAVEFMRLFNHLYFRTVALRNARLRRGSPAKAAILDPDDRWVARHFRSGGYHDRLRRLFR